MCVILVVTKKKPTLDILERCEKKNSDGAGIAYFDKDNHNIATFKKNLKAKQVFGLMQGMQLPLMVHFRKASVGGLNPLLTQPFIVTKESSLMYEGTANKLLMHNGTFPDWRICLDAVGLEETKDSPISDSRAIAMIISKNNEQFLDKIGKGSYALMNNLTQKIYMYGHFVEDDGIRYSNLFWKWQSTYFYNDNEWDSEFFQGMSRKERKRYFKKYTCFDHAGNDTNIGGLGGETLQNGEQQPLRLHEEPVESLDKMMGETTKAILNIPFKTANPTKCCICQDTIEPDRVKQLYLTGGALDKFTCNKHAAAFYSQLNEKIQVLPPYRCGLQKFTSRGLATYYGHKGK